MKVTLLPPKMERWLIQKTWYLIQSRATKLFGRENSSNGTWSGGDNTEVKLAYEAYKKDVWMYASIFAIASSATTIPSGVYKRSPSTKGSEYAFDENDQITKVWTKPNSYQTRSEFIEDVFWSLELSGKLFIEVVGTKKFPQEMFVLDPRRMKVKKDTKKFVSTYEYDLDGKPVYYNDDDIIFHRYHDPGNHHEGLSASTPAGDSINSDILSNQYNNAYYGNSAIPVGTLETERRMTNEECDLLRMQWDKGHKGARKAGRIAILYGGLSFKVIQKSPKDMEFIKQKMINREEILASYGVPPVLVGLLESVNYGNSKEQRKLFWNQTMRPKLSGLSERMNLEFGLDGFKRKFAFDMSEIDALQENEEIKSRIAFNLSKSGFSWDEIRKRIYNLPPLPDDVGKYPWVPANMVPAILQMNGPAQAPVAPGADGKPGKPDGPSQQPGPENQKPTAANKPKPGQKPTKPAKDIDGQDDSEADYLEKLILV